MIQKYEKYLDTVQSYLKKFFEQQKPYIFCKEGCSICCETGHYPTSELELKYLDIGFSLLDDEKKKIVRDNIAKIKKGIEDPGGYYRCPFLINSSCSVYKHRPIICRVYGLLFFLEDKDGNQHFKIPCCVSDGLNYSNVYDEKSMSISSEKFAKLGIKEEPLSYNVGLKYMLKNEFTEGLEFGENKKMIDWFD